MKNMSWLWTLLLVCCSASTGLGSRLAGDVPLGRRAAAPLPKPERAGSLKARDFVDADGVKVHWALLVAGSAGWGNYRHQADVCHAYQVLRAGGLSEERIVVMMYDDLAYHPDNPHPGKIINRPGGPNVYRGVPRDYIGQDVNSQTFLAVLAGNRSALVGKGSGKVVDSGPSDRVFIFYSDHGAAGVVGMPAGPFLYADELMGTLRLKHQRRGYKEMVVYIEACESGSMFEGLLDEGLDIYATTAANAYESSWATYCPGMYGPDYSEWGTCLGDLYSVGWIEDSEAEDLTSETLEEQYELVRQRTSNNYTYMQGSHVMQYGRLDIDAEVTGDYLGMRNGTKPSATPDASGFPAGLLPPRLIKGTETVNVQQRDADLVPFVHRYLHARDPAAKHAALTKLHAILGQRQLVDDNVRHALRHILRSPKPRSKVLAYVQQTAAQPELMVLAEGQDAKPGHAARSTRAVEDPEQLVESLVNDHHGRPHRATRRALVDDWSCLRGMVRLWEGRCGSLGQYGMRHTRMFANLCNAGLGAEALGEALGAGGCGAGQQL